MPHHDHQRGQRNRIETRHTSIRAVPTVQSGAECGRPPDCLIQERHHTDVFSTIRGDWQPRSETPYYVRIRELSAYDAHHAVRDRWAIENTLHHVLDVALVENASRICEDTRSLRPAVHLCAQPAASGWPRPYQGRSPNRRLV